VPRRALAPARKSFSARRGTFRLGRVFEKNPFGGCSWSGPLLLGAILPKPSNGTGSSTTHFNPPPLHRRSTNAPLNCNKPLRRRPFVPTGGARYNNGPPLQEREGTRDPKIQKKKRPRATEKKPNMDGHVPALPCTNTRRRPNVSVPFPPGCNKRDVTPPGPAEKQKTHRTRVSCPADERPGRATGLKYPCRPLAAAGTT